jgi:hypothetical protein
LCIQAACSNRPSGEEPQMDLDFYADQPSSTDSYDICHVFSEILRTSMSFAP